jgi:hypothetical protein
MKKYKLIAGVMIWRRDRVTRRDDDEGMHWEHFVTTKDAFYTEEDFRTIDNDRDWVEVNIDDPNYGKLQFRRDELVEVKR